MLTDLPTMKNWSLLINLHYHKSTSQTIKDLTVTTQSRIMGYLKSFNFPLTGYDDFDDMHKLNNCQTIEAA